jgi:hypothetical protein
LESSTGAWVRREEDLEENGNSGRDIGPIIPGVKPFVTDNRNILLLRPLTKESSDPSFLKTLAYAFQRGIQVIYQVEEQEVAVELIGRDEHQRILLWEAAEGGTGVWDRILNEKRSFAEIAKEALRICHFDPATKEEIQDQAEPCGLACYDCLLSYANQMDHRFINRKAVKDFLLELGQTEIISAPRVRTYEEQYQWLSQRLDPASPLEKEFLDYLHTSKLRLPDFARYCPESEIAVQSDFYYQRDKIPGVCVFINGPVHDNPEQAKHDKEVREALQDKRYRVIAIRHGRSFRDQIEGHEVFKPV